MSIPTKFNPMGADNDNNNSSGYLINPIMLDVHTVDTTRPYDYVMTIDDGSFYYELYKLFDDNQDSGITIPRGNTLFINMHFDRPLKLKGIEFISKVCQNNTYDVFVWCYPFTEVCREFGINMGEPKFVWYNNSSVITTEGIYMEISTHRSNDEVEMIGMNFMLTD